MKTWDKLGDNPLILPDPRWYETVDWRDPFVYRDEDAGCFKMLISARLKDGPQFRRGCIAVATSDDLDNWEVGPPLVSSMLTHCPECPEIFKLGDWWYLVESRYSERMQTLYRVAKSPEGPWESRKLDSLDGRRFYAAKSASDGDRRFSFAWIPFRKHHEAKNNWVWGGELGSPRELVSLPDGTLISRLPQEVDDSYASPVEHELRPMLGEWKMGDTPHCDATGAYAFAFLDGPGRDDVLLDVVIEPGANTEAVGVLIEPKGGDELESGYCLSIEPMKERVLFDRWPDAMDPLWDSLVLNERHNIEVRQEIDSPLVERPLAFTPEDGRYRVQILRKGQRLNASWPGGSSPHSGFTTMSDTDAWGLFVQEGAATFHDLTFRK